jgi:hypothetical protein
MRASALAALVKARRLRDDATTAQIRSARDGFPFFLIFD